MSDLEALLELPLIAILRGVTPDEVLPIADALLEAGFRCLEVPLSSPDPFESLARLSERCGERALIGAGAVVSPAEVAALREAGGRSAFSPHFDPELVRACLEADLVTLPGVLTPSEAFAALRAGAHGLRLFPASAAPPPVLRALRAALPLAAPVLPVGGIGVEELLPYRRAGASGFGLGSALYRPGDGPELVRARAARFVSAWRSLQESP